ncbi:MAG: hypothetical protein NTY77_13955 [Elusimicrobia bacterium]|nr:hypothetical protein [Elusimicrobiota bacterium]
MKKVNLKIMLELAAAFVFLGVPSQAGENSVMTSQLAIAAKAGAFSTLTPESTLGRFEGIDSPQKGWLSKAPSAIAPVSKTPEALPAAGANLKTKAAEPVKSVEPRKPRVSRLQEPGEALGGGAAKRIRDEARMLAEQATEIGSAQ